MASDITAAQRAAVGRYEAKNYDKHLLRLRRDALPLDAIKAAAAKAGQSVNAYITQAIRDRMTREAGV